MTISFSRKVLGQLDWLPSLVSAGLQAGATTYGAYMQQSIAKMQANTQKDIAAKQAQAAQAAAAQQAKAETQATQVQASQAAQAAAAPKILGIDQGTFIVAGIGVALVFGVVAIAVSKKSSTSKEVVVSR